LAGQDQITRHEREIGELRGKLDSLATKEYMREVLQEQTRELKAELNPKFDQIFTELRALNAKQHRITGAADIIKTAVPLLVSIATLIVLIISLLANAGA